MTKPKDAGADDTRPVRLYLSPEHHRLLRQLAAKADKPMSRYVRELVEKEIERRAKQVFSTL